MERSLEPHGDHKDQIKGTEKMDHEVNNLRNDREPTRQHLHQRVIPHDTRRNHQGVGAKRVDIYMGKIRREGGIIRHRGTEVILSIDEGLQIDMIP